MIHCNMKNIILQDSSFCMYNVLEIWQKKKKNTNKPAYRYDMNMSRIKDQKDTDQVVDNSCLWVMMAGWHH